MNTNLTRNPALSVVATYRRAIGASLDRVWENVLDWEHLPWVHSQSFASIRVDDAGAWGWRAKVCYPGSGESSNLELSTDPGANRYVTRVLDGPGAGGEIWTTLCVAQERVTQIEVEFCVEVPTDMDTASLGKGYLSLYQRLWDEDEAMMQERQSQLDRREQASALSSDARSSSAANPIELGSIAEVGSQLPLCVEAFGARMRIVEVDDEWILHSLTCPHLLGPLDECEVVEREVVCPWHGYRFDLESGRSSDGRRLRLSCPARLEVDRAGDRVRLVPRRARDSDSATP